MRYAIFSDIHANLEALEAVLRAYKRESIDKYICVGDIVGYGADPEKCLRIIQELGAICVAGNHDWAVVDLFDCNLFNLYAKEAIFWTKNALDFDNKRFLKQLKLTYSDDDFVIVHGSLLNPERFSYLCKQEEARANFKLMEKKVCFIGHTHVPGVFSYKHPNTLKLEKNIFSVSPGHKFICNVGSVGQPRDGIPLASYCVYDTKKKLVEIKRIVYNIVKVQNKIRKSKLPEFLAARLSQGR